jgi:hypothetical protein
VDTDVRDVRRPRECGCGDRRARGREGGEEEAEWPGWVEEEEGGVGGSLFCCVVLSLHCRCAGTLRGAKGSALRLPDSSMCSPSITAWLKANVPHMCAEHRFGDIFYSSVRKNCHRFI